MSCVVGVTQSGMGATACESAAVEHSRLFLQTEEAAAGAALKEGGQTCRGLA